MKFCRQLWFPEPDISMPPGPCYRTASVFIYNQIYGCFTYSHLISYQPSALNLGKSQNIMKIHTDLRVHFNKISLGWSPESMSEAFLCKKVSHREKHWNLSKPYSESWRQFLPAVWPWTSHRVSNNHHHNHLLFFH